MIYLCFVVLGSREEWIKLSPNWGFVAGLATSSWSYTLGRWCGRGCECNRLETTTQSAFLYSWLHPVCTVWLSGMHVCNTKEAKGKKWVVTQKYPHLICLRKRFVSSQLYRDLNPDLNQQLGFREYFEYKHPVLAYQCLVNFFAKTKGQGQRSRSKFPHKVLNTKQLAISLMLFHPQTSSYLLSQLFVTHLGIALLLPK